MELRLILGDQLHPGHSWFSEVDQNVTYVMMEVREEASYAPHHIQKILCFFAAMRHFAADLRKSGHQVKYLSISDSQNCHSIIENLKILLETGQYSSFCYQEPDEYRLDHQLKEFVQSQNIQSQLVSSEHFLIASRSGPLSE
ncbi:MAG: cryptochrome/photolyase family protein [Saprospiraceae bacterium]|nr:cryptochrome/photolyase family protein [Saprospiraceae bacterium]